MSFFTGRKIKKAENSRLLADLETLQQQLKESQDLVAASTEQISDLSSQLQQVKNERDQAVSNAQRLDQALVAEVSAGSHLSSTKDETIKELMTALTNLSMGPKNGVTASARAEDLLQVIEAQKAELEQNHHRLQAVKDQWGAYVARLEDQSRKEHQTELEQLRGYCRALEDEVRSQRDATEKSSRANTEQFRQLHEQHKMQIQALESDRRSKDEAHKNEHQEIILALLRDHDAEAAELKAAQKHAEARHKEIHKLHMQLQRALEASQQRERESKEADKKIKDSLAARLRDSERHHQDAKLQIVQEHRDELSRQRKSMHEIIDRLESEQEARVQTLEHERRVLVARSEQFSTELQAITERLEREKAEIRREVEQQITVRIAQLETSHEEAMVESRMNANRKTQALSVETRKAQAALAEQARLVKRLDFVQQQYVLLMRKEQWKKS